MTSATLSTVAAAVSDELESPARRALRRLFQRRGAVVGLVVIATFVALAGLTPAAAQAPMKPATPPAVTKPGVPATAGL